MFEQTEPVMFYYHTVTLQLYVTDDFGSLVPVSNSMWYAPHLHVVLLP